ncbi:MAG TPA: DNA adenine methylase [Oligoflexia bacterium]|nr:DNA adenine methylase [Oligoflexia bacterium]
MKTSHRQQLAFFDFPVQQQVVNVASVPQRSPFRYPGGKTWFVPTLRQWLGSFARKPREFVEPFVGGGIISLTVAFENLAHKVLMAELDDEIAAVWTTILTGGAKNLAQRIVGFELSCESVKAELAVSPRSAGRKAFQTILKNRTYHGGILAPGSGLLKNGENGKGIHSRWYPQTLYRRILAIEGVRDRIQFIEGDGLKVLGEYKNRSSAVFFIDPPYTVAGKRAGNRLYKCFELDHELLFSICESLKGDFLMTYDNEAQVRKLANKHGFDIREIPMKNTHHATMRELVIGKDLSWL